MAQMLLSLSGLVKHDVRQEDKNHTKNVIVQG